ncbi:Uncharacterised protein [Streptococcus suis]|uniref:Uncharacterized protein n=1 Tax=Streptococcus suis TaxID=1307 RepID=A0A0Z8GT75_STRSU|nr:hypothetical protein [Streptococcus suis]NQH36786.1 hypothetical protein [Streptococcus suis]NQH79309.1 hypothetical protein [Streptococcus suis]NQN74130.1 hypothetical protein [Streptococcus suis]NQN79020.1 hypothetical protein [Streptococcus suis]CYU93651.1 Uncharacterised protein [Streptococcus suis]
MKFWDMMKKFLSVDEEEYTPQSQHELERELAYERYRVKEFKKLADLKEQECIGKAKLIKELYRRIEYLEKVNRCQAELLADRED